MVAKRAFQEWFPLFLISALGLFLELAFIRWLSAEVRLFSYFKNLPLLAAFLGLAIGFALVRRGRGYQPTFAPVFGMFIAMVLLVGRVASPRVLAYPSKDYEFLWFTADISYWLALGLFLGLVLIFFLLTLLTFIPLGQAIGQEMARHASIPAYIANLLASLAGVWLFGILSLLQTPPIVWLGLTMLGLGYFWATRGALSSTTVMIFVFLLVVLACFGSDNTWSPYHRLDISELQLPTASDGKLVKVGYTLKVQQVFYQSALDLSPQLLAELKGEFPAMDNAAYSYNLPFRVGPQGARVLVVGAGMGNDVAAALRNGWIHSSIPSRGSNG